MFMQEILIKLSGMKMRVTLIEKKKGYNRKSEENKRG